MVAGVDDGTGGRGEGTIKRGAVLEPGGRWSGSAGGEDMPEFAERKDSPNALWISERLYLYCCST